MLMTSRISRLRSIMLRIIGVVWLSGSLGLNAVCQLSSVCQGQERDASAARLAPAPLPAQAQQAALERLKSAVQAEVDAKRLPALSIAVVAGDQVIWSDGFASRDRTTTNSSKLGGNANSQPITADTIYRVGSVSKLFTDIAVMQLVESGKVSLDAPVSQTLPSFQPRNPHPTPITLRQLMSHRAGLVREPPVGHYFDPTEPTLAATVASLNQTTLTYPPETRTKYSNAGISVVGAIVEAIAGQAYDRQIEQKILQPLGMTSSSFTLTPELEKRLAPCTMWTLDGRRFAAPQFKLGTAPAGNLYSSVTDLANFIRCLHAAGRGPTGEILKPESLATMMTPGKEANGSPQGFGLGFHVAELNGVRRVGHGGAVYGCATQVEVLPDEQLGIAAVAALDCANGVVERLANYGLSLLLAARKGEPLPEYARTTDVPAERARSLVGTYAAGDASIQLSYLAGRLQMQRGALQTELKALPDSGELIVDDVLGYGTRVVPLESGHLKIADKEYAKIADQPPQDVKDSWKGLIGEYGWDHDVLYILENRGRLVALIEWFYAYPLTEIGPDEFAFPDYGLYHGERLYFHRDAAGQATKVVAAEVPFLRREVGTVGGKTFKIQPLRPIEELRAGALQATPPNEQGEFRDNDLVELKQLVPDLQLDIRYATTNNFADAVFYTQARAFMQRPAAEALKRVQAQLRPLGYGLLIHDAYRPWSVTKMFWDATPDSMKDFVANPANGSRHNRGCAVDLSLVDLSTGQPIEMVSGYDEFSPRAFPGYPGGTSRQRWHRDLLRHAMEREGFQVYEFEWWHFDFGQWKQYRIGNTPFEKL